MTAHTEKLFGIVADDLTGATTTAAWLARAGIRNSVFMDGLDDPGLGGSGALLVSTDSRSMSDIEARAAVRAATAELVQKGTTHFAKRIDTTLRGNVGAEVEGMLEALGERRLAVVVPAMPPSKRIVLGGYSVIDSELLARTGVANDPLTPVTESNLVTLLNQQFSSEVDHISIDWLLRGHEALHSRLLSTVEDGYAAVLIDSVSADDVTLIAQAVADAGIDIICVDPGYFTAEYAKTQGFAGASQIAKQPIRTETLADDAGTVVVVAGSATAVTREQLSNLANVEGTQVCQLPVELLMADEPETPESVVALAKQWIAEQDLGELRVAIVTHDSVIGSASDAGEHAVGSRASESVGESGRASERLVTNLALAGRCVVDALRGRLAGLYATGGDTMVNMCHALEAGALELEDYVIPQSDQGHIVGGPFDQLPIVGKGGLTGNDQTAIHIVNRLFDERKIK